MDRRRPKSRTRLTMLRRAMRAQGLDAMLISSPPGIRYVSGFTGSYGLCLVTLHHAWCLTDSRYRLQLAEELHAFRPLVIHQSFGETIARKGLLRGCRTAGIEERHLTLSEFRSLRKESSPCSLKPAGAILSALMSRKDSGELLHLRKAVQITDEVFCDVLKLIRPGATEQDLAAEISYRQRRAGAEGDAFDIIVASGPRSALPHARATPRKVRNGELVLLDFGCVVEGYHSDMTRTVAVGRVSSAVREAYQIVLQAQEMGIGALEKGRTGREIDLLVRSQISHHGLRRHFPHSTGHGVGLRIHESPWLGPRSKDILEAGNVVAVEPGIYLPGIGGIRIEDVVLVTEKGRRVLTAAPKELMVL